MEYFLTMRERCIDGTWHTILSRMSSGSPNRFTRVSKLKQTNRISKFNGVKHYTVQGDVYYLTPGQLDELQNDIGNREQPVLLSGSIFYIHPGDDYYICWMPYTDSYGDGYREFCYNNKVGRITREYTRTATVYPKEELVFVSENGKPPRCYSLKYYVKTDVFEKAYKADLKPLLSNAAALITSDDWQVIPPLIPSMMEGLHATSLNTLAFSADLNVLKQWVDVLIALKSPGKSLKEIADLYLSYTFGASATTQDYKTIVKDVCEYSTSALDAYRNHAQYKAQTRSHKQFTDNKLTAGTKEYYLTAYMDNYDVGVMNVMRTLDQWGLYPDHTALWDFVPFSFVVDWFIDVGGALAAIDHSNMYEYYMVKAATNTVKAKTTYYPTSTENSFAFGQATISAYERKVSQALPQVPVELVYSEPLGTKQWITGAALVIQKLGR